MRIATHLIKIKGKFDKNVWTDEDIKSYALSKIKREIESLYHADLELFSTNQEDNYENSKTVDVYIFVSALLVTRDIVDKWIKNHIIEKGITVIDFEIKEIFDMNHPENKFVVFI